jgi:membrane-bound ClpP family serine protease
MNMLIVAIVLLLLGMALSLLEVFIPSHGALAFLSFAAVVAAVIFAFREGTLTGLVFLGVSGIAFPTIVMFGFRIWPHTPIGKRVLPPVPASQDVLPEDEVGLDALVGRVGVATCLMVPSGAVEIDGRTLNAVSAGMPIEAGQKIIVVETSGRQLTVRPYEGRMPQRQNQDLAQSIESLGLEGLDDPLA